MAFNWEAGLSALGQAVSQTVGVLAIEEQRASLSRETMQLADQLANERESRGRAESHTYAMEQQGARLAAEEPHRKATTESLLSGTRLAEEEAGRKRAAIGGGSTGAGDGSYDAAVRTAEGGVDANGRPIANKLGSGAFGPYQFMPGTWAEMRKQDPSLPEDMTKATPEQHKAAFDRFTAGNATALQKAGLEATPGNLYLAHRFGAGGAEKVIKADAKTPLSDVLPVEWQKQNPDMQGKTAGDFRRFADEKMKGVTTASSVDPITADINRVSQYDPKAALEGRIRQAEIGVRREEAQKDRDFRASETDKHIAFEIRKAQRLMPMEGGMMGAIDMDGNVRPITGPDGKPYTGFVDKERQSALQSALNGLSKQGEELTRLYATEMREGQARLKEALNPANAIGKKDAGKEERDYIESIKADFERRIGAINGQTNSIIDELMGKVKPRNRNDTRPPLGSFRLGSSVETPLLQQPL